MNAWANLFVAFGISIQSRCGEVPEVMQMLAFAQIAERIGVARYVESVFYDSKSGVCSVALKEEAQRLFDVQDIIGWCGDRTLSLFDMDIGDGTWGIVRGRDDFKSCGFCGSPGDAHTDLAVMALRALAANEAALGATL